MMDQTFMNRRTFIKTTSALSTFAAAGKAFATERQLRKGIMYATIKLDDATVLDKFKAVKAAGFDGIEPMSHMSQAEVLDAFDTTGLSAASVCCETHWKNPVSDPSPEVRAIGVRGLEQALRDAKAYGATSVLFVPAVVNKQVSYKDAYTRSQAEIRKVLPLAQELGVKIAIENVWNHFLLSPLEAARYIDEFESPAIGWHFDVGNVINFGWPEQWIRILGKRIQKLHIKEYSRKLRDQKGPGAGFGVELMEGDNDWPSVMKALDEIGYEGWGILEVRGGDAERLKFLAERTGKIFAC